MTSHPFTSARSGWDEVQRRHLQHPPRIWGLLLICVWGALGCQANIKPPRTADKHAQHDNKSREAPVLEYPEHVAPPPAYGNKVVMAGSSEPSTHF